MVDVVVLPAVGSLNTKRAPLLFCHDLFRLRYFFEDIFGDGHIRGEGLIIRLGLRILDFVRKLRHFQWVERRYIFLFFRAFAELVGDLNIIKLGESRATLWSNNEGIFKLRSARFPRSLYHSICSLY